MSQVSTDHGTVGMFDARQDKQLWTLNAHPEGVNGMSLSAQCPDCLVTGSSDKTIKIWDLSDGKPTCVQERNMKLGTIHCLESCPDAPFVMVMGGDKPSDNLKVLDIRESAAVRSRFGNRILKNPLNVADFGYNTANEAETATQDQQKVLNQNSVHKPASLHTKKDVDMLDESKPSQSTVDSGGAAKKFLKKQKKKKKKEF